MSSDDDDKQPFFKHHHTHHFINHFLKAFIPVVLMGVGVILLVILWAGPYLDSLYSTAVDPFQDAKILQKKYPMIDGHNDVPWQYRNVTDDAVWSQIDFSRSVPEWNTDVPRLREGEVGAQFWSVYVPCSAQGKDAVRATLEQIDVVHKMNLRYNVSLALALTPDDINTNFKNNKISSLIGIEGAHQIDASLGALRMMYKLGVRYMTLTHTCNNEVADSEDNQCTDDFDCRQGKCINGYCSEPQTTGITDFGLEVIAEMNRLGMLVDLSHVSRLAMLRALNVSKAPVIFSHSCAYSLCDTTRNVPDDVLLKLKDNGGIVMVTFLSNYLRCSNSSNSDDVVDHIDYIAYGKCPSWKLNCSNTSFPGIGVDHIGYGSDFDGATDFPSDLQDVSSFITLTAALLTRQYSSENVVKIFGGNLLRVFQQAIITANKLTNNTPKEIVVNPARDCRVTT